MTAMVCPNCRSNEVIAVQGENFCINCGQLVPKSAASPVSTEGLPDGVQILPFGGHASVPLPGRLRRKPGRPKAGRLDVPGAATARITASGPTSPASHLPAAGSAPTVMQDILQPKPLAPPRPQALPTVVQTAAVAYGAVLSGSLSGRLTHRRFLMAVVPAALIGIMVTVSGLVLASAHPGRLVSVTVATGWPIYGELIIVGLLYYLVRSLSHAAIIFGSARLDDHRPLVTNRWLEVAADSQGRRFGLDILAGLGLAIVSALGVALFMSGSSNQLPVGLQASLLAIAYAALAYVGLALMMTVSLGHVAVTLTNVRTGSGLKLGWRLFRHHFELAGARITALTLELIGLLAVAVGAGGWLIIIPDGLRPVVIGVLGLVLVVVAALAGAGAAIWWQSVYRLLISADHPAGFHRLLSTATPKVSRRTPIIAVVSSILILSALAAVWPWISA